MHRALVGGKDPGKFAKSAGIAGIALTCEHLIDLLVKIAKGIIKKII